jgi:hypothetical protein
MATTEDGVTRGQILAFGGLVAGGFGGWTVGKKRSEDVGFALAAAGAVGGIVAAHLLNTKVLPPSSVSGLGDVPPGFYEVTGGPRFNSDPVFVRGQLISLQAYADQQRAFIMQGAVDPEVFFRRYPRWTLYGGPTSAQWIDYVENLIRQWADQNGYRYLPDKPALIVEPDKIKPTWPYNEFRYTQQWEPGPPRTVWLGTLSGKWGWHYA